jgi:hypothetical protein
VGHQGRLSGQELADAIKDMAQLPDAEPVVERFGHMLFGPVFRMGRLQAIDRHLAKAHHSLPIRNFAVGTAAIQIAERDPARIQLLVANLGTAIVYVGSDRRLTVGGPGDPEGGWPLFIGASFIFDKVNTELWAISSIAAQDVRVLDLSG